ncbi:DNA internalization-related competence protein ComEC/Rec2 [Marinospirillum perlucidum]|uniref:DNA internalization-related competence protein ComEC/Rec2 n=1 Tax=Marinospirillum perlucidum TaxID=1982602 RepID=UPI000DF2EE67|nr:DNA internalization-related competence protein ComEC/Rec2 [Marinospirillum perlucidum]
MPLKRLQKLPGNWLVALGFLLGIQSCLLLSSWPPEELLLVAPVVLLQLARRKHWLTLGILAGFLWILIFLAWQLEQAPSRLDAKGQSLITGQILEARSSPVSLDYVILQVETCQRQSGQTCTLAKDSRIRLNWYAPSALPARGEVWQLEAAIRPLRSLQNFNTRDFSGYQLAQGWVARGYVGRRADNQRLEKAGGVEAVRTKIMEQLQAAEPNPTGAGFFLALALGERQALTASDWDLLEATGTVHLWVVSGLHLGMLAGLILWLARRFNWPWVPSLLLALTLAWSYAFLAGWGVAAQRSAIMLALGALLLSGWRQLSPWTLFSLALLAVLIINPLLVLTRGFWLSFGAVALLLMALKGLPPAGGWRNLVRVQLVIALGLTPLLIWQGAEFSIWAPLVNLIAVPLVGLLLLPASLISLALVFMAGQTYPAVVTSEIFAWVHLGLAEVASWPGLQIYSPAYLWLGLLFLLPPGFPGRLLAPWGLVLAFIPLEYDSQASSSAWTVTLLDVGQGTSVLVENTDEKLLYDTGRGYPSGWAPAVMALEGLLQPREPLEYLVVSHDDGDHAGGWPHLLKEFPVETTWLPHPPDLQQVACQAGQQAHLGDLDLLVLWPPQVVEGRADNSASCVLLIRGAQHSLLLTGDASSEQEAFFAQALPELLDGKRLSLLVSGHHGSRTSTSQTLLEATQPRQIVHTAGWQNAYGHPAPEVVDRGWQLGARQYTTGEEGALAFEFHPQTGIQVTTRKNQHQPLWYWLGYKPK